jgi:hypothetical protein
VCNARTGAARGIEWSRVADLARALFRRAAPARWCGFDASHVGGAGDRWRREPIYDLIDPIGKEA